MMMISSPEAQTTTQAASNSFPLLELPSEVLSCALGSFLDGKSMSTFMIVVQGCSSVSQQQQQQQHDSNSSVLILLRNALVHRYGQLQRQLPAQNEEIRDVLMVLREDIRTSQDTAKFSEWCAILDYFESQRSALSPSSFSCEQSASQQQQLQLQKQGLVVWVGPLETIFGTFTASLQCTTEWTLGALNYWRDIELEQFAVVHPFSRNVDDEQFDLTILYGRIQGVGDRDVLLLQRQNFNLEDDVQSWQHYLVLRNKSYDEAPTEFFTPVMGNDSSLFCYWDYRQQTYDWEEALDRLGESVIRIMSRYIAEKGSFP